MWFYIFLSALCIFICVLGQRSYFLKLRLFFYAVKLRKKQNLNDVEKFILENYPLIKNSDVIDICLKKSFVYADYLAVLDALDKRDECEFSVCNVIAAKKLQAFVYGDKMIVAANGSLFSGQIVFDGEYRHSKHFINRTQFYYQKDGKIYKSCIFLQKGKLQISGASKVKNLPFSCLGGNFSMAAGAAVNVFSNVFEFLNDRKTFLEVYEKIAQTALFSAKTPFKNLVFDKILHFSVKNHFQLDYSIFRAQHSFELCHTLCAMLCGFGFNILLSLPDGARIRGKDNALTVSGEIYTSPFTESESRSDFSENLFIQNHAVGKTYNNLSAFYTQILNDAHNQSDNFLLLLLSLSCDKKLSKQLLFRVLKQQTLGGRIASFSDGDRIICDNNDYFTLLFPLFLNAYMTNSNDFLFFQTKTKYTLIKPLKKSAAGTYGLNERIYPADSVYEHAVKCFECFDFKDGFLAADGKKHIAGFLGGVKKHKNFVFTMVYLYSIKTFSRFFSESDYNKFMGFAKRLENKIKNKLSDCRLADIPKAEKLMLFALSEGVFCDKQFSASYDFNGFYDFFEYFADDVSGIKTIDTALILFYIIGNIFENKLNAAYCFTAKLCEILQNCGEKLMKPMLCFDGTKFYFSGNECKNMSVILYFIMREKFSGVKLNGGNILLGNFFDSLDESTIEVAYKNSKVRLYFKKSGKNRVSVGRSAHINLKSLNVESLNNSELTVEF